MDVNFRFPLVSVSRTRGCGELARVTGGLALCYVEGLCVHVCARLQKHIIPDEGVL